MYQVISGATEAASNKKMIWKVATSILALLAKPSYDMSADVVEGLSKGSYKHKALLIKQVADN